MNSQLLVTSDQKELLSKEPGVPGNLIIENVPTCVRNTLKMCRFVDNDELLRLAGQTSEICVSGKPTMEIKTRGAQFLQRLLRADAKRSPRTNMAMNGGRCSSKPRVTFTGVEVNSEVDRVIESGVRYIAVLLCSKIGMNTVLILPECMAIYGVMATLLQSIRPSSPATERSTVQIHHVHVAAPWLSDLWFGGKQRALYTRGNDLSISVNCGKGYIGLFKKAMLAAHMWYGQSRGIGFLHAGAVELRNGRIAVISGASALGKSEISMPLNMLATKDTLEFVSGSETVTVQVPGEYNVKRLLFVDDMLAYRIIDGRMYIIDLETGNFRRIDAYKKQGDIPLVDRLVDDSGITCVYSNIGWNDDDDKPKPEESITMDGKGHDNPRIIISIDCLDNYQDTIWEKTWVPVDDLIVGIPSAQGIGCPTITVLNKHEYIVLMLAGLRANHGNQSIEAIGEEPWTNEGALTLTPFSPMTDGEVANEAITLLSLLSPTLTRFFFVSNRFSTGFKHRNKYDGSWLWRYLVENGFELLPGVSHKSRFLGCIPILPDGCEIDMRLFDPSKVFSPEQVAENTRVLGEQIIARLSAIELDNETTAANRECLRQWRIQGPRGGLGNPERMQQEAL